MERTRNLFLGIVATSLAFSPAAAAQGFVRPAPTAADWAALAKRPDFTGVWETAPGGRGGGGRGAAPAGAPGAAAPAGRGAAAPAARGGRGGGQGGGPSLTPAYAAKTQAQASQANRPEDNQTANCLPPGLPG